MNALLGFYFEVGIRSNRCATDLKSADLEVGCPGLQPPLNFSCMLPFDMQMPTDTIESGEAFNIFGANPHLRTTYMCTLELPGFFPSIIFKFNFKTTNLKINSESESVYIVC